VRSKENEGSTFWVELPLGVGQRTLSGSGSKQPDGSHTFNPSSDGGRDFGKAKVEHWDPTHHLNLFEPRTPLEEQLEEGSEGSQNVVADRIEGEEKRKEKQAMYSLMEQGKWMHITLGCGRALTVSFRWPSGLVCEEGTGRSELRGLTVELEAAPPYT